jgi:hypothetical protein
MNKTEQTERRRNEWHECASVTKGGKPYFLYNPARRLWIVWDRFLKQWELRSLERTHGLYNSPIEAQTDIKFGYIEELNQHFD